MIQLSFEGYSPQDDSCKALRVVLGFSKTKGLADDISKARHDFAEALVSMELALEEWTARAHEERDLAKCRQLSSQIDLLKTIKRTLFDPIYTTDLVHRLRV